MLMVKGLVRSLFQTGFYAAVFLIPAGTWRWPRALQFLVVFGVLSLLMIAALARWAPLSLEARVQRGAVKNQPAADKVASAVLGVLNLAWFMFIAFDVHRLQVFPMPPLWLSVLGAVVGLAGYAVMVTAIWQNPYAAPIVGDQSERNQVVIETGIYARIRHPLYLGYLAFLAGLALWLGSVAALIVLPVVFSPVIARILIEEKTLRETLPGYDEYQETVRSRLIPAVW
jgi:protein-S-isoprenylcysteine O-methyltransferase Ste14